MSGDGHAQGIAVAGEPADRRRCQRRDLGIAHAEIAGPQHLDLAERDAAGELAEVFAIGRLQHQAFKFAELPCRLQVLGPRSEEHTSELQSLMRISYAVFCLKKKNIYKHIIIQQYY